MKGLSKSTVCLSSSTTLDSLKVMRAVTLQIDWKVIF